MRNNMQILLILLCLVLTGCSTKQDIKSSKVEHQLEQKYNKDFEIISEETMVMGSPVPFDNKKYKKYKVKEQDNIEFTCYCYTTNNKGSKYLVSDDYEQYIYGEKAKEKFEEIIKSSSFVSSKDIDIQYITKEKKSTNQKDYNKKGISFSFTIEMPPEYSENTVKELENLFDKLASENYCFIANFSGDRKERNYLSIVVSETTYESETDIKQKRETIKGLVEKYYN